MKTSPHHLVIAASASPSIGSGHVLRMLALAQSWQRAGGVSTLLSHDVPDALAARVRAVGVETVERRGPREALGAQLVDLKADWAVIDDYDTSREEQESVREVRIPSMLVDDHARLASHLATVVLDQNAGATAAAYGRADAQTRLLLGPRYALLRDEFRRYRGWVRTSRTVGKIVVTLGGAPDPATLRRITEGVALAVGPTAEVVVAPGMFGADRLRGAVGPFAAMADGSDEMADLLASADVAVTGGGTTLWELSMLGVPAVVLTVAANQRALAVAVERAGAAIDLGWADLVSAEDVGAAVRAIIGDDQRRLGMTAAGQQLVDGYGGDRVVMTLQQLGLWLEAADTGSSSRRTYRFADRSGIVGDVWFDWRRDRVAAVDLSVAGSRRGRGLGAALVAAAIEQLAVDAGHGTLAIEVDVPEDDVACRRTFVVAGFSMVDPDPESTRTARYRLEVCG